MVVCDLFEVCVHVSGDESPIIDFVIRTDLPVGTQILLSCRRTYRDSRGEESLWVGQSERVTVSERGECRGRIDIASSDMSASEHYRQINAGHSPPGISSSVSDTVTLTFVVGGRQRVSDFGRNNSELSGSLVVKRGGIKIVEAVRELRIPMTPALQPSRGI